MCLSTLSTPCIWLLCSVVHSCFITSSGSGLCHLCHVDCHHHIENSLDYKTALGCVYVAWISFFLVTVFDVSTSCFTNSQFCLTCWSFFPTVSDKVLYCYKSYLCKHGKFCFHMVLKEQWLFCRHSVELSHTKRTIMPAKFSWVTDPCHAIVPCLSANCCLGLYTVLNTLQKWSRSSLTLYSLLLFSFIFSCCWNEGIWMSAQIGSLT